MSDSDKPKFDPSKPFDAVKPKFDPTQAYQAADEPTLDIPQSPSLMDRAKQFGRATVNALPMIGGMVGGVVGTPADVIAGPMGTVAGAGLGAAAGTAAKNYINSYIDPDAAPKTFGEGMADQANNALNMATAESGGQLLGKAAEAFGPSIGKYLGSKAEKLAENATGATAKQAQEFAPGTGRALLDNGIVKFGRSQQSIANAAQDALDTEGNKIGSIIKDLSDNGATGNKADLLKGIDDKIAELGNDPAQAQVVKQLQGIKETVAAGPDAPTLSQMENTKRGFQKMVNYNDPEAQAAKAAVADVYKTGAEDVATQANPEAAQQFQDAKKLYGQLSPVADASARRAAQLNQSPHGGIGDFISYGIGGAPAVVAKRFGASRSASSLASGTDSISKFLMDSPAFQQLAQRSPTAFQSMVQSLSGKPNFQPKMSPFAPPDNSIPTLGQPSNKQYVPDKVSNEKDAQIQFLNGN